jgi:hypothetical protein
MAGRVMKSLWNLGNAVGDGELESEKCWAHSVSLGDIERWHLRQVAG